MFDVASDSGCRFLETFSYWNSNQNESVETLNPIQLAFHYLGDLTNPNSGELLTFAGHLDVALLRRAIELAWHVIPC